MEAGRCVVKRVVIETREVPPDDCYSKRVTTRLTIDSRVGRKEGADHAQLSGGS
jgi:hypothetical protein